MLGVLVIYVAWLHATLCPGAGVWCNHIAPLPGASCPGALINGFRGEPEEAAAPGWSYLGPRCTWARHLHHCLACCNLALLRPLSFDGFCANFPTAPSLACTQCEPGAKGD